MTLRTETDYEDLLSLWADLETGLGVLLPLIQLDRDGSTVIADLTAPEETMTRVMQTLDGFVRRQAASR